MITSSHPRRALTALGLAALLALTACGGGGDDDKAETTTTTAAETTTTTEAETTTTTEAETTTTESTGELRPYSFSDDFSSDTGWLIGCNEDSGCALVRDGRLGEALNAGQIEVDQHSEWEGQILANVSIETLIRDFGEGTPQAGPVCHFDRDQFSYYDFTIAGDGSWSLYKFPGNGQPGEALARGPEAPIFTRSIERVLGTCEIQADGSVHLTMTINGQKVSDIVDDDDPLLPGEVGLVTYGDPDVDSSISFDEVTVEGQVFVE